MQRVPLRRSGHSRDRPRESADRPARHIVRFHHQRVHRRDRHGAGQRRDTALRRWLAATLRHESGSTAWAWGPAREAFMTVKNIAGRCARGGMDVSRRHGRQTGAIGIMFAGGIIILLGFFALALDLSQLYNRKMELQNVADAVALN